MRTSALSGSSDRVGGSIDTDDIQLSALIGLVASRPGSSFPGVPWPDCAPSTAGEWLASDEAGAGSVGPAVGAEGEQAASARTARAAAGSARW